ncbi:hypothetical protein [Halorubrum lipolyticum]|uniref:hypothetical protein n=1 Tax=Halorubrum lipolyticum TaxID=368624 RepID=UPI000677AA47|nr:hypothetical protein [Halorubrum lipolyticum]
MAHKLGSDPGSPRGKPESDSDSEDERDVDRGNDPDSSRFGRRTYLKAGAAAATVAGLGTGLGTAAAAAEREGIAFERVVDAVDDLGMDPTGGQSVTDQIADVPANTLVQFPDGDYLIDERLDLPRLGNVGFEAIGDATIVGAAGFTNTSWNVRDSAAVYYAGFTHDQSDGAVGHFWRVSDRIEIHDIDVVGRGGDWGVEMSPSITDSDGVARIVNYTNKKGSSWASYSGSGGRMGFYLGPDHSGTAKFVDCDLREYGNNALYTSRCPGNVQVFDSYFENNNVASVRIGGEGSFVENTRIVVSEDRYTGPRRDEDKAFNMRGVLLEENHKNHGQKAAGAAVRGCEILVEENPTWAPAIMSWSNGRSIEVTDTTITYENTGGYVICKEDYSNKASHPAGEDPRWLRMDNVTITGSGDVPVVVEVEDADGTEIRNCSIHMTDNDADGIRLMNSDDCVVADTNVVVPGSATDFQNSQVETRNVTHEVPEDDGSTDDGTSDDGTSDDGTSDDGSTDDGTSDGDTDGGFRYDEAEGVHTDLPKELVIEQVESGARVSYEVEVDGALEAGEWEYPPTVDGTTATGGMGPSYGLDNLYYDGEVTRFEGENLDLVRVFVADAQTRTIVREVDPLSFPAGDGSTDDGSTDDGSTDDGSTDDGSTDDGSTDDGSTDDGSTDDGSTDDGSTDDGSTDDDTALDSVVAFDGSRSDEICSYRFSVTGEVVADQESDAGETGDWDRIEDTVGDGAVVGVVHTGVDTYRFSGDLVDLELRGSAAVTFDDQA